METTTGGAWNDFGNPDLGSLVNPITPEGTTEVLRAGVHPVGQFGPVLPWIVPHGAFGSKVRTLECFLGQGFIRLLPRGCLHDLTDIGL